MGDVSNGAGAAIYARFSSENQREASIDDQIRVCTAYLARDGRTVVETYADYAISGARCPSPSIEAAMDRQSQIDAAMGGQILRRLRFWPLGKVGRRADGGGTHVRSNAHRNHVFCHHLPGANPGVVSFSDDIGQAVSHRERQWP